MLLRHDIVFLTERQRSPSEVTIGCAATFMGKDTRKENVGPVFESCSAYVVDEHLNPVLRGAAGELIVGGPLVGRGYHNRPDLTKKSFVTMEGVKAYRTGDLGMFHVQ